MRLKARFPKKFFINGRWHDPHAKRALSVVNPATEKSLGDVAMGDEADFELAISAARSAFTSWSESPREVRLETLNRIITSYEKRMDDMAEAISQEMGAPLHFARSHHAPAGLGHFKVMTDILRTYEFERQHGTTQVIKEPVGVCLLITPWNWPINQIACKVAPALAAGCTMVLKPSEVAPDSALLFAEILDEADVPPGVFNLVNGEGTEIGPYITSHPGIDMVSFTGSTRAGVQVAASAAPTVKRVCQELGGKSANIILDDANLEFAVTRDVKLCMSNAGQSCNAPTRLLVPEALHEKAKAIAIEVVSNICVDDPLSASATIGPVASPVQWNKVQNLIKVGVSEGADLIAGGPGRPDHLNTGYFVKPTLFANVTNDMNIAKEEIFGPVLCLMPYEDDEHAIEIANDTIYGLSGYVSSGDLSRAKQIGRKIRAGNIHLNGAPVSNLASFGGYKRSGNGREWGEFGLEDFLEIKSILGFNA